MASYTPNYNLKKPAGTDVVDIDDLNGNMDIIDTQLNSLNSNKMNSTIGSSLQSVDLLAQAPGAYRYNGNCSNIPSAEAGFMQLTQRDSATEVATVVTNSGRMFTNVMLNGSWVGWQELAQNSNLTVPAGSVIRFSTESTSHDIAYGQGFFSCIILAFVVSVGSGIVAITHNGASSYDIKNVSGNLASEFSVTMANSKHTITGAHAWRGTVITSELIS